MLARVRPGSTLQHIEKHGVWASLQQPSSTQQAATSNERATSIGASSWQSTTAFSRGSKKPPEDPPLSLFKLSESRPGREDQSRHQPAFSLELMYNRANLCFAIPDPSTDGPSTRGQVAHAPWSPGVARHAILGRQYLVLDPKKGTRHYEQAARSPGDGVRKASPSVLGSQPCCTSARCKETARSNTMCPFLG